MARRERKDNGDEKSDAQRKEADVGCVSGLCVYRPLQTLQEKGGRTLPLEGSDREVPRLFRRPPRRLGHLHSGAQLHFRLHQSRDSAPRAPRPEDARSTRRKGSSHPLSAKILEKAINYIWRTKKVKRENKKNILDVLLVGHSWFKTGYTGKFGTIEDANGKQFEFIESEDFFGYTVFRMKTSISPRVQ